MSDKELLKSAKAALKAKEFKEAMQICKSIIDKDKENYLAWVMTGAAAFELQISAQALASYQRAIQISSTQAPAWQGMAQLYEKIDNYSELDGVYNELRKLFKSDPTKYFEYSLKHASVLIRKEKKSQAVSIYDSLLEQAFAENKEVNTILENMAKLLADPTVNDQPVEVYLKLIEKVEAQPKDTFQNELIVSLNENALRAMIRLNYDWKGILTQSLKISENLSINSELALNTILDIHAEMRIGEFRFQEALELAAKSKIILEDESYAKYGNVKFFKQFLSCLNLMNSSEKSLGDLKQEIDELQSLCSEDNLALCMFLENSYYSRTCDFTNVIRTSESGLKLVNKLKIDASRALFELKFRFNMAFILLLHHDYSGSASLFEKIQDVELDSNLINYTELLDWKQESTRYLIECYLNQKKTEKAVDLMSKDLIKSPFLKKISSVLISFHSNDTNESFEKVKELAEEYPENHDCHSLLARVCYHILEYHQEHHEVNETKSLCFQSSIKAIKLCPYRWESIYQLGKFYKYFYKDTKKALKCFQKSYELCRSLELCGLELVDCFLNEKEDDIAFSVLQKAVEEIENCKWACLRLGIMYLKKNDPNEAIRLFQSVIRHDPHDHNMWECLADAYLKRGSMIAALKSFNNAIELNSNSTYSYFKIAHIKQTLKLYDDAVIDYFSVLNRITNHVPTLKGLGETYYELARHNIKNATDNKYLEYIESSVKYLSKAILLRKDICCMWNILGNCCALVRYYPNAAEARFTIPKFILEKNFSISESEEVQVTKLDMLRLAEESFRIVCKFKPDCSSYWHELAMTYFYQYQSIIANEQILSEQQANAVLLAISKSKECMIKAINLEPENHKYWNSLGLLYASKEIDQPHLAQHCFIKSIKLEDSDAVTWTNLGVFYLIKDEIILAHECFKKSQAIDPEYNLAWIGQAYIAESVDLEQCIDLYRHAVELGLHTESNYGFARIVCKIFTDPTKRNETIYKDYIEFLYALPKASDSLVKYCDRIVSNPDAFYLCGVLLEKLRLPQTAMQYYNKVFDIVDDDSHHISIMARRALARLLCEQDQYEASLIQYKKFDIKNSIEDLFALAKVFYKLGKYQQCFKLFESALTVSKDNEKSIVYTAMGMTQAKINIQEAIACFFKSFQCEVKCIQSLFALCSIGLLKKDKTLISAVFKELNTIKDLEYKFDIMKLKAIYYCLEKEFDKAKQVIGKYVHEHPNESKGWIELCLCLKRSKNFDLALSIGQTLFKISSQANLIFYECMQFLLLQKLKQSQIQDENGYLLKTFQKTLHMFPAHIASWNIFSQFLSNLKQSDDNLRENVVQVEASLRSAHH